MLSADELERYARHIVLREVGGPGQAALKEASVLVIGADVSCRRRRWRARRG
jgi:molybdopterin/thiamine biosynthesis adenylyltransferase